MGESFFGLNVAVRGLFTAQRSLNVVNHNLNNVNTPGYSRQVAVQTASKPMALYDGTGMVGTGSDVVSVERIRDEYLDFKYWSENISYGEWLAKSEALSDLEAIFNEPSGSGFTTILGEFYSSLQELTKDPGSPAARALVQQRGVTVAKYFNSMASHLEKMQYDLNYRINTKVDEINSLATQIQQLNRQIYTAELDGSKANDLRDQRTVLVDKMSKIINIEANEVVAGKLPSGEDDKHFVITISGKAIVDHFNISKLETVQRQPGEELNEEDIGNLYDVQWADGNELNIKGGELRGYLDVRDGNEGLNGSPLYNGIPFYLRKLNEFVRTFAMAFNEGYIDTDGDGTITALEDGKGHADGYMLDSTGTETSPAGIRFFTILGTNNEPMTSTAFINGAATIDDIKARYVKMTAKNFTIGQEVLNDTDAICTQGAPGEIGNIDNLNAILKMRHNPEMFTEGAPEDFMKSLVAALGVDSQQALRYAGNQQIIVGQITNRRLSDSGVSIDEEMANMIKFQHAYNASAKMIQTMAEIYDTLINKLGVG